MIGRGGARRRRDTESGVSAIEFVLLTPFLFFLIFVTVQFAIYFFARHVAIAAAQEGDRVARAEAANPAENWSADATDKAKGWVNQLAPSLLVFDSAHGISTGSTQNGNDWNVSVTVSAKLPSLLFWTDLSVTESSTGPVERFIPDN